MRVARGVVVLLGIVFILPVFGLARSDSGDAFVLSIDRIKHSIAPIVCGKLDDKGQFAPQLIEGTGFFIDTAGHFVTDSHVIDALGVISPQQPVPCIRAIYIPDHGWQREAITINFHWYLFGECKQDSSLDLAVCKLVNSVSGIVPLSIAEIRPPDGTEVAFSGFPLGTIEPVSARCNIATFASATDAEGSRLVMLDKGSWSGASGSPIFTADGIVIGIMQRTGTGQAIGIGMGMPSHFILKFLSGSGIDIAQPRSTQKKGKK